MNVLIVENDRILAASYQRILSNINDISARVAHTSDSALDILDEDSIDCILADMMLGSGTIFGLLHELQSHQDLSVIPVVLCTAASEVLPAAWDPERYGIVEVLDKTNATPERLVHAVIASQQK